MYNRTEIMEAIEAANDNIKTAKEQMKRADKMKAIQEEIFNNNSFGCILPGFVDMEEFENDMRVIISTSTENLKKYKKMLKLLDQMEALNN